MSIIYFYCVGIQLHKLEELKESERERENSQNE